MTEPKTVDEIRDIVASFARRSVDEIGASAVYLFGSLVYRAGARFNEDYSDVDVALLMPNSAGGAVARADFVKALRPLKAELELRLAAALSRSTATPVCSLMAVTGREVGADIHKDGAEGFFASNEFLDVLAGTSYHGFPGAAEDPVADRLLRQCFRFAQRKRHAFLRVAANGKGSLEDYSGEAPLPKDLLRHFAMAAALKAPAEPGAEYDTQEGLSQVLQLLTSQSGKSTDFEALRQWILEQISSRRKVLGPGQQLILSEMIWSLAEGALSEARSKRRRNERPRIESTVFFYERVCEAFPGKRGVYSTEDSAEIEMRLTRLLGGDIDPHGEGPIWKFRGSSTLPVKAFRQLEPQTYLFGNHEVKVRRLTVNQSEHYAYSFVYVEGEPLSPTGVDERVATWAEAAREEGRITTEEYGLTDDGLIITREELDDGAAERGGAIIDTIGRTELRVRYLTPVNFILCGHMAPLNNKDFDIRARELLDRTLAGEDLLPTLAEEIEALPRRD